MKFKAIMGNGIFFHKILWCRNCL